MEKVKELWLKNKYNIFIFIGMIIFTIAICTNFIKPHFALDTYCVYSYDSQELISHFNDWNLFDKEQLIFDENN